MPAESVAPLSEQEFSDLMTALGPFEPKPKLAVAFSGGADSTAMVLLAARWAKRRGGEVLAVTVDHGLRSDSAAEAKLAQSRIKAIGIDGTILRWKNSQPSSGIQNAARIARYELMSGWCRRKGILHLLLAHHQEDQAETMLHRLGRQTGADGLAGMARIRETADIRLLRPCLNVSRNRLQAVVESKRGRMGRGSLESRSGLCPGSLAQPVASAGRGTNFSRCLGRDSLAVLPRFANRWKAKRRSVLAKSAEMSSLGYARLDRAAIIDTEREIARRILERLLGTVGGNVYPAPSRGGPFTR